MKEEIKKLEITLEEAKEWYFKGGEWSKLALRVYSKDDLGGLSSLKTWEDISRFLKVALNEDYSPMNVLLRLYYTVKALNKTNPETFKFDNGIIYYPAYYTFESEARYDECVYGEVGYIPVGYIQSGDKKLFVAAKANASKGGIAGLYLNGELTQFKSKEIAEHFIRNFSKFYLDVATLNMNSICSIIK
jgi:hypothetical protein